jgi:hypothetical protein
MPMTSGAFLIMPEDEMNDEEKEDTVEASYDHVSLKQYFIID